MNSETKQCNNCGKEFTIEPEDFAFYEKIKVPPPTWCPECRMIRRMLWRNERSLYKRKCDLCGQDKILMFHSKTSFLVYCYDCWWSDKWDPLEYGLECDFAESFFQQFYKLLQMVPRPGIIQQGSGLDSEYTNRASNNKNCYLIFGSNFNENCLYGTWFNNSRECLDGYNVQKSELCYECIDCIGCYNLLYSRECNACSNSYFLLDCRNCDNCFGCVNLRNKNYCIFNREYAKEEYQRHLREFDFGNIETINKNKSKSQLYFIKYFLAPAFIAHHSVGVSGNWFEECKNTKYSFNCRKVEDSKYVFSLVESKDAMDYSYWGKSTELIYDSINIGYQCSKIFFNNECWNSATDIHYSMNCHFSSRLFGCVGLRNKEYCILNKQYTKEEYEFLVPKIIEHMNRMPYVDKKGRVYKYGEFFPPELSPFAYNETVAQEYFPLTKEQALEKGYRWREPEERNLNIDIKTEDLPDHIKDVKGDIVGKVIECANAKSSQGMDPGKTYRGQTPGEFSNCTTAFKIIPQELAFYRRMNLPLPRLCPNCRHYQRLKQRNPLKLWHRQCMCSGKTSKAVDGRRTSVDGHATSEHWMSEHCYVNTIEHFHGDKPCPQEFETTYAPDRPEIVYCEECYKREVN